MVVYLSIHLVAPGSTYVEIDTGPNGDGLRRFLLSIPQEYDPTIPHKLIMGFTGRDAEGELMQHYLGLENEERD